MPLPQPHKESVILEIFHAVRALPPPAGTPRPLHLLLDGFALLTLDGHSVGTLALQRGVEGLDDMAVEEVMRWGWAASAASGAVWDVEGLRAISATQGRRRNSHFTSSGSASRARGSATSRAPRLRSPRATASRRRRGVASRPSLR